MIVFPGLAGFSKDGLAVCGGFDNISVPDEVHLFIHPHACNLLYSSSSFIVWASLSVFHSFMETLIFMRLCDLLIIMHIYFS